MITHRTFFSAAAAIALAAGFGSAALGNQVQVGPNDPNYRLASFNGGEFTLIPLGGDPDGLDDDYSSLAKANGGFQSFCLEQNERLSFGATYNYAISTAAILGGEGGPADPLSKGTAWLYSQFAQGTLANYDYTSLGTTRATDAKDLQRTIWWLEGGADPLGNDFQSAVLAQFGSAAAAMANASGSMFGVRVLNLTSLDGQLRQDQLVYNDGFVPVPDGGTSVILLGMAIAGLGVIRRKLQKA